jgi:hypothetical protein
MPLLLADSNSLRKPILTDYLSASPRNKIGLSEHVLIEQHKNDPAFTARMAFARTRQYPSQVILLKTVPMFYGVNLNNGRAVRRMIDRQQSKDFAKWYDDVLEADQYPQMMRFLLERQKDSLKVIEDIASEVHFFEPILSNMRSKFSEDERRAIKKRDLTNDKTMDKLMDQMFRLSLSLFKKARIPEHKWPAYIGDAPNYLLFRYAACVVNFFIHYVYVGNLSPDTGKLVNHIMDLQIAAQATYYNGVLTTDKVLLDVFRQTRRMLRHMHAYLPTVS